MSEFFIVLFGILLCVTFTGLITCDGITRDIHRKAIEAGVGEYVITDSYGNTEFQWITPDTIVVDSISVIKGE